MIEFPLALPVRCREHGKRNWERCLGVAYDPLGAAANGRSRSASPPTRRKRAAVLATVKVRPGDAEFAARLAPSRLVLNNPGWPQFAPSIGMLRVNSARQRLASPASLAPKPREVKDYSGGTAKPDLRRTAWWDMQDSNPQPNGYDARVTSFLDTGMTRPRRSCPRTNEGTDRVSRAGKTPVRYPTDSAPTICRRPDGAVIFLRRRWQDGVKNAEKLATGFRKLWPQVDVIVT